MLSVGGQFDESDFVKDRGGSGRDRGTSIAGNAKRFADFRPRCRMTFYSTTKTSGEKISGHLAKESYRGGPQFGRFSFF
jgi:hypothetical protein